MTYTISMDIFVDDDNIMEDDALEEAIKDMMNMVSVSNFRVLEIND
jgi:hypothetical protein